MQPFQQSLHMGTELIVETIGGDPSCVSADFWMFFYAEKRMARCYFELDNRADENDWDTRLISKLVSE